MDDRVSVGSRLIHRAGRWLVRSFGGQYGVLNPGATGQPEQGRVALGPIDMAYHRWAAATGDGDGVPVVMVHGLNNNPWCWARVARSLGPPRPVWVPAQRGHGRTTAPPTGYQLEQTTDDLLRFFDAFSLDRVDLVGHSWGGKVSCHLTGAAPDRVRSLVLCDPVPPIGYNGLLRTFPGFIRSALAPERGPFADADEHRRAAEDLTYLWIDDDTDRRLWEEGFVREADGSLRHTLPESGYDELLDEVLPRNISDVVSAIRCPVLLLQPTLSVSFVPGETRRLRRVIPQLRIQRVPGDHAFIHTNPLDTAGALDAFWGQVNEQNG